jgi:phosphatidylinositol 4-kinase
LAGLFRALQLSPFLYKPNQLLALCKNTQPLIRDDILDLIRVSITSCLKDAEGTAYSRRVLARYWEDGVPLSSNRVIHDLLIVFRNTLTRVLAHAEPTLNSVTPITVPVEKLSKLYLPHDIEDLFSSLLQEPAQKPKQVSEKDKLLYKSLKHVYLMSLGYYEDIRKFAEKSTQEGKKWAPDAYMQEIMGTSLVSVCFYKLLIHNLTISV